MLIAAIPCVVIYALVIMRLPAAQRRRGNALLFFGVFSILPVVFFVTSLEGAKSYFTNYFAWSLYEAFVLAAIPEELVRYLVMRWTMPRKTPLSSCLLWGCLVGLGFGSVEYLLFVYSGGWRASWERAITSLPYHTAAGGIIGYWIGRYLHAQVRWSLWGLAITIPLHAFNNFNLRNFESIDMNDPVEPTHSLWQLILFSHWPSNLLVTFTAVVLCFLFNRQAKQCERDHQPLPSLD